MDKESKGYRSHNSYRSLANSTSTSYSKELKLNHGLYKLPLPRVWNKQWFYQILIAGFEQAAQRSSMALHGPSQLSPAGSLKVNANVGPKGLSGSNSPRLGTSSPRTEGTLSPWFPSSYQSSATNSPPQGRPLQGHKYF